MRSFQRGAVRLHVLHHAAREPVHGTWLMAELQKHGHGVSPGTLYPILHSMEAHGLITSEHSVVVGRRLRRYVITDKGRAALEEAELMLGPCATNSSATQSHPIGRGKPGTERPPGSATEVRERRCRPLGRLHVLMRARPRLPQRGKRRLAAEGLIGPGPGSPTDEVALTDPKGTPSQASVDDPGVDGLASVQEWLEPEGS